MGRRDNATFALIQAVHADFLPGAAMVGSITGEDAGDVALLEGRDLVEGSPAVYVCRGYTCGLPVTEAAHVSREIRESADR